MTDLLPTLIPLWQHQKEGVRRAIHQKDFALFFEMGCGKSATTVNILRHHYTAQKRVMRTLILAPIIVVDNWKREFKAHSKIPQDRILTLTASGKKRAEQFGEHARARASVIAITNFESLNMETFYALLMHWQPEIIVCDECFPAGTLVDTPQGKKAIETLRVGDKILNVLGEDTVTECFKKNISQYVEIEFGEQKIECSFGHLWLTKSGWKKAIHLIKGDELVTTNDAMRIMQNKVSSLSEETILRGILCSEMENKPAEYQSQNVHERTSQEDKQSFDWDQKTGFERVTENSKSDVQSQEPRKSEPNIEGNELGANGTAGQWSWINRARKEITSFVGETVCSQLCGNTWQALGRKFSLSLQNRYCIPENKTSHRGRWLFTLFSQRSRSKKGKEAKTIRVEGIKIFKQGSTGTKQDRCFYDLSIAGHPSFSLNGVVVHNSQRIKNPKAKRTKLAIALGDFAKHKYILSGTPILNDAMDVFAQYRFLDGGETFGKNFFEFRGRYFEDKNANMPSQKYFPNWQPRAGAYQEFNRLLYLKAMRVLKKDCLDLPPLVRKRITVELTPAQKKNYLEMQKDFVAYLNDNACVANLALTKALRLLQISSGFFKDTEDDDSPVHHYADSGRIEALRELLEMITPNAKVIIWACFRENYVVIEKLLNEMKLNYSILYGGRTQKERIEAVDAFQNDSGVRVMVANQAAGGVGINLTAANYMIYFSRNFSLEADMQSEARNHRGGSEIHDKITRIDLVAPDTIDETVLDALLRKENMASNILAYKEGFK